MNFPTDNLKSGYTCQELYWLKLYADCKWTLQAKLLSLDTGVHKLFKDLWKVMLCLSALLPLQKIKAEANVKLSNVLCYKTQGWKGEIGLLGSRRVWLVNIIKKTKGQFEGFLRGIRCECGAVEWEKLTKDSVQGKNYNSHVLNRQVVSDGDRKGGKSTEHSESQTSREDMKGNLSHQKTSSCGNIRGKAVIYFICSLEVWSKGQGWAEEETKFQRKEKIPKSDLDLAPGFTHHLEFCWAYKGRSH